MINQILNDVVSGMNNMGPSGWAIVGVVLVTFGVICMRGYGSRSNY